jgi:hypothetical protein
VVEVIQYREIKEPLLMRIILLTFIISGALLLSYCGSKINSSIMNEKEIVVSIVKDFGSKLKNVPLLASKDVLRKSMEENYTDLVSDPLIEKWIYDPLNAPGRLTSSPWPDRIDILSTKKISKDTYQVNGEIIEVTSVEKINGGIAAKRPITLILKKINNKWMIYDVTLGSYRKISGVEYENKQYGFDFTLPESWKGYKILTDKWEGYSLKESEGGKIVERGPLIYIRHPMWSEINKRQDIPVMVFTLTQWTKLQKEEFHIGAAPIGPKELGRNSSYVFALPARYNYAFPAGYEEVEYILNSNSLKPTENYIKSKK